MLDIHLGPYPIKLLFLTSKLDFNKYVTKLGCPDNYPENHGQIYRFLSDEDEILLIIVAPPPFRLSVTRNQYAAMLAHEATHAAQYVRECLSENEPLGSEPEAYLVQYIVQECLNHVYKG